MKANDMANNKYNFIAFDKLVLSFLTVNQSNTVSAILQGSHFTDNIKSNSMTWQTYDMLPSKY